MSKIFSDIHTHTVYSHGKGTILDNAEKAHRMGLKTLGISDHGPGHLSYGLKMDRIESMREDIEKAKQLYPDLEILLGVEANIVNKDGSLDVSKEDQKLFDYVIAGYHYAYLGSNVLHGASVCAGAWLSEHHMPTTIFAIERNTDLIVKALYENDIKVLTHPGDKMKIDIKRVAQACERTNTLLEINEHHCHLTREEIDMAQVYNVNFILSSDAHLPECVGEVDGAYERALASELDLDRIVNLR